VKASAGEVQIVEQVPQAFADLIVQEAPTSIALSGGDTARQCYELLATAPVDWRQIDVWFSDERWVPIHDHDSNEGMARVTFLDEVEPHEVRSMRNAGETIDAAALAYDDALRDAPPLDLVHLGLGVDGHTASLFPGSPSLAVTDRLVIATGDDLHPHPRLTFTHPALARARLVVFTVVGEAKREALRRVCAGDDVPASRVEADRVIWLVDGAAAGPVPSPGI
jgi:6-phosphogluconolactonase